MDKQDKLIDELIKLLRGGMAHASLTDALEGLPAHLRGKRTNDLPYSIWQLVEHIRIAQWDMLEFSKDASHQSPKWPDDYWPKEAEPESDDDWDNSVAQINKDLEEFIKLLKTGDLHEPFEHGDGQTLLREALQIGDHNAYHTAEIIVIRRLLDAWK